MTGNAGQAVLGKALSGGMKETADWVRERYGMMFDAVYVPPGQKLAVHITRQLAIDFETKGARCVTTSACPAKTAAPADWINTSFRGGEACRGVNAKG
ncbi:hypothetical protein M8494_36295 [Serratia ureilytica]